MSRTPFLERPVVERQQLVDVAVREWMIRGITAAERFHQCLSSPPSVQQEATP